MLDRLRLIPGNYKSCKETHLAEAVVTSKGRITIPAEIRKRMNLNLLDKVVYTVLPNGTTIMRAKNRSIACLA